jgi:hypothetical protein
MSKAIRITRGVLMLLVGLGIIYLICLLYPQPFFSHRLQKKNITVYTGSVPPHGFDTVLDQTQRLLARSDLNDTALQQKVFICPSLHLFGFLTRGRTHLAGLCDDRLSRNIFIRPTDLSRQRIISPPEWSYAQDSRPLSYFLAHEITHSLESHYAGRWNLRVPVWLWEGYAEYIGVGPVDLNNYLYLYRAGSPLMDPENGTYARYLLYVLYLIDYKHLDIKHLLLHPPSLQNVEKGIQTLAFP